MPFSAVAITFLKIYDAVGKIAIWLKSGPNSEGNGVAVEQFYTNDSTEKFPGEITAYMNGSFPQLAVQSPSQSVFGYRASLKLKGGQTPGGVPNGSFMALEADQINLSPSDAARTAVGIGGTVSVTNDVNVGGTVINSTNPNWIAPTLGNSWANYGLGGYDVAGYCQHADGTVELKGLIKSGTVGTFAVFTLPAGMRPGGHRLFAQNASGGIADVRVFSTGAVYVYSLYAGATNGSVSLDGIRFRP